MNTVVSKEGVPDKAGLDCFFIEQNGNLFKSTVIYRQGRSRSTSLRRPYFYIAVKKGTEKIVASYMERKYRQQLSDVQIVGRLDVDKIEHITGV